MRTTKAPDRASCTLPAHVARTTPPVARTETSGRANATDRVHACELP
jgi:hypothetical protein